MRSDRSQLCLREGVVNALEESQDHLLALLMTRGTYEDSAVKPPEQGRIHVLCTRGQWKGFWSDPVSRAKLRGLHQELRKEASRLHW
ncbi:unnamed protein product, partial [Discosporangium mesarthrocarpum]